MWAQVRVGGWMGQWKLVGVVFLSVSICSPEGEGTEEVLEV